MRPFRPVTLRGQEPLKATERASLVGEILVTYCMVRWAIRGNDLPNALSRLRAGLADTESLRPASGDAVDPGSRLGYVVGSVLRLLPTDSRCLMRSLVLTRLLARRGLSSSLVIGVSAAPEFAAHAWVEQAGRPLLPAHAPTFARLVEL